MLTLLFTNLIATSADCENLVNLAIGFGMSDSKLHNLRGPECCGFMGSALEGVSCDDDNRVYKIVWDRFDLNGTFNSSSWSALPLLTFSAVFNSISGEIPLLQNETLKYFYAGSNKLQGPIPKLHSGMTELGLENNMLYGSPALPSTMKYLYLMNNHLSGNFSEFPPMIIDLYLYNNYFEGEVPSFPSFLVGLGLQNNIFVGKISNFPNTLEVIKLQFNRFTGKIETLPPQLYQLYLDNNNFDGEIPQIPSSVVEISLSRNQFIGSIESIPQNVSRLYLDHNKFGGSINISGTITILHLEFNEFQNIKIEGISQLKECDISNNKLNISNYKDLSQKCRLEAEGNDFLSHNVSVYISSSTSLVSQSSNKTASHFKIIPITTTLIAEGSPNLPNLPTTNANLWVVIGSVVGVLIIANLAIQSFRARVSK
eukprot:NODE_24_length_41419_cov_0.818780.p5 type:complete len:427 gc:universal NODE_24_length_41419_cov_0.818780:25173-26453(+)